MNEFPKGPQMITETTRKGSFKVFAELTADVHAVGRWEPSCHYARRAYLRLRLTQKKQSLEMKRNRLPSYIEYLDPKSLLPEISGNIANKFPFSV